MPVVSHCASHHICENGSPAYKRRFDKVLPFHTPGLAPVRVNNKAWHIHENGEDAYSQRYDKTFGFYCGVAAVIACDHWFHIKVDGSPLYPDRYEFVGNFQSNLCVVCNNGGEYFHIDLHGLPAYNSRWSYCGDFRESSAVVQRKDGLSTHIDENGKLIHSCWFQDLDVYHKGFARALDEDGWHHINRYGKPIYQQRYAHVEAFYNGCSRVTGKNGSLLVIDETGHVIRSLRPALKDEFSTLSDDLTGYWRTFALATAVKLDIFEYLPETVDQLASRLSLDETRLGRLLLALVEIQVLFIENRKYHATPKGQYLCSSHDMSLRTAAIEYSSELLNRWKNLPDIIRGNTINQDIFQSVAGSSKKRDQFHQMLSSYALHDYTSLIDLLPINNGDEVFDAAGGSGALSKLLAAHYPAARVTCGDLVGVVDEMQHVISIDFDLFQPWPVTADKIILARVLHDWNDTQVIDILIHAGRSLNPGGEILIVEMLVSDDGVHGALCDLHLMASTGGADRRTVDYESLLHSAGLNIASTIKGPGVVSILRAVKNNG